MPDDALPEVNVARQVASARRSSAFAVMVVSLLLLGLAGILMVSDIGTGATAPESQVASGGFGLLPVEPHDDLLTLLGIPPRGDQVASELAVGREVFPRLVLALGDDSSGALDPEDHGLEVRHLDDGMLLALVPVQGRDRGWGRHAFRVGSGVEVHVEVPHPVTDRASAQLGVELFEAVAARRLTVAGASRRGADGRADAAHDDAVPFDAVHRALLPLVDLVVQVHGFATQNHPDLVADVVISPGPGVLGGLDALARGLEDVGLRVCLSTVTDDCDALAGRTNLQGASAAKFGVGFLHIEVADTVRADEGLRVALVGSLAAWIRSNV